VNDTALCERLDGPVDQAAAFEALFASERYAFWLDRAHSGVSLMGSAGAGASVVTASVASGTLTRLDATGAVNETSHQSIFAFLRHELGRRPLDAGAADWVGWIGYEAGVDALGLPAATSRYPDAALMRFDRSVAFDSSSITVTAEGSDAGREWMAATILTLHRLRQKPQPAEPPTVIEAVHSSHVHTSSAHSSVGSWRHSDDDYIAMVRACQDAIVRGDAYVLCLTNELRIPLKVDAFAAYRALRTTNPTQRGGIMRADDLWLVSASPEQFLRITPDGVVTTMPVKGTRPRGVDAADDARLRGELVASEKERAENLMIVDLMRNDLTRVARLGTVEVTRLLEVETYASVHQLVSTVRAQLGDGKHAIDAIESCFPAGSMTGTPKRSAISILGALERGPRGIYSGCFGLFSSDGSVDVSMVIRSMIVDPTGVSIGAGGGITSLSIPDEELAEVKLKARSIAAAARASAFH
jgi:anthranilate/para-aminobenzoate synthase component I